MPQYMIDIARILIPWLAASVLCMTPFVLIATAGKEGQGREMNIVNSEGKVRIRLEPWAYAPERAYRTDAGMDLRTPIAFTLGAREAKSIDTGVHVEIPKGIAGFLKSKSGLNVKYGITSEGVIDAGYTGSIMVKLYNNSNNDYTFEEGDKISQLVLMKIWTPEVEVVDEIVGSDRGSRGFGSTGR